MRPERLQASTGVSAFELRTGPYPVVDIVTVAAASSITVQAMASSGNTVVTPTKTYITYKRLS